MNKGTHITLVVLACLCWLCPAAWAESPWDVSGDPWQGRPDSVLRNQDRIHWVRAHDGRIPDNAVEGGRDQGNTLYICRAGYQDGTHIGKVVNRKCNIGWGGREVVLDDFAVLVQGGRVRWVGPGQRLPRGAVFAGRCPDGDMYVCRGGYRGGTHLGKLFKGKCNIGYGGKEVVLDNYQVLIAPKARWMRAPSGQIPAGAIGGGHDGNAGMYVCRGYYKDGEHPGKTWKGRCNIGWGGREVELNNYDVLVQPGGLAWLPKDQAANRRCVRGGQEGMESQCVCRGGFRGGLHPGKTWRGNCNIGYGGKEYPLSNYEVLVAN